MSTLNIQGNTGDVTSKLVLMNQQLAAIVENTKKATESSTKQADATKKGIAGMIERLAAFITMQKSNETFDAMKNVQAQWGAITGAISGGLAVLTMFRDELMKVEQVATEKTALKLLSQQGEDLNVTLAKTRDITHGVAKGTEILETVNKLLLKGFKLTGESLEQLIDISGIYSSATGEDMNSIMMRLATASQRESEKMFEKLGIYIDIQYELDKYAKKVGTTADRLDEATKANVLLTASMREQKKFLDEKGLTNESLESPVTWQYKKAEDYMNTAKKETLQSIINLYLEAVPYFENLFQKIADFNERMTALWSQGWDAYNAALKRQGDRRYKEQQVQLVEENRLFEENKVKESDIFKKYSDQQTAYGITNKETVWKTYNELMDKLKKESSTSTLFVSYKLFDIDPMRDKRNLAAEMFFTTKEIEDYLKIGTEAAKKYYDELKKIKDEKLKIENNMEEMALDDKVKVEELRYNRLFDEFEAFSNKKVKHTKKYMAELALLEVKVAQQAMIYEKASNDKRTKDEKDANDKKLEEAKRAADFELWLKKDQNDSELDLLKQHKEHKQKIQEEDIKVAKIKAKEAGIEEFVFMQHMGDLKKEGIQEFANFSSTMINEVILGEKKFQKEMIGDFAVMIGSQLVAKGTFNVLEGVIATAMGMGWGPTQLAVGGAEIAAGAAMGGLGKAIGTTSKDKSKDESAKDRNDMNKDNKQTTKVNTYLFPSKRAYNQNLQQSNAEIYG